MPSLRCFSVLVVFLGMAIFAGEGEVLRSLLKAEEPLSLEAPGPPRGSRQLSALNRAFGEQSFERPGEAAKDVSTKNSPSFGPVAQASLGRKIDNSPQSAPTVRTASMQADDFAATEQNPPHEIAEPLLDGEVEPDSSGPETMASPDSGNYLDSTLSFSGRGTGDAKLSKPSLSSAITPLFSILGSLLIVLACFMILMMLMKKISPKGNRNLPPEVFEDLGRTFLTQKLQLHLLKLGNRLILVSVTQDGVTPITEITDPDEVVPLIGMCRGQDTGSASGLFKRTLSELSKGDRDGYFGEDVQTAKPAKAVSKPATKAAKPASPAKSTLLDLYSEPDESLAEILASGLGTKGAKHA